MGVPPDERFAAVADTLGLDPAVTHGRMFGSGGLKADGKIFAMLVKERLVVKLPAARVEGLVAAGDGEHFDPGHGRLMKEWISLAPGSRLDWTELAVEARDYVSRAGRR